MSGTKERCECSNNGFLVLDLVNEKLNVKVSFDDIDQLIEWTKGTWVFINQSNCSKELIKQNLNQKFNQCGFVIVSDS
jgi:hypothetical protein